MKARIEFKPRDLWVGAYFRTRSGVVDLWITLIPMFPLHLRWGAYAGWGQNKDW